MDELLWELQLQCTGVYINDIKIYSPTQEQHLKDLDYVLEKLHQANLKVNMEKCAFMREKVVVLEHLVNIQGIKPNPEKKNSIIKLPALWNISEMKKFLGDH